MANILESTDTFEQWMDKINGFQNEVVDLLDGNFKASVNGLQITISGGLVRNANKVLTVNQTTLTIPVDSSKVICILVDEGNATIEQYDIGAVPETFTIPIHVASTNTTEINDVQDLRTEYALGGGGGGSSTVDGAILLMDRVIDENYTIPANKNALSISPEILPGVEVTVPVGAVWAIV